MIKWFGDGWMSQGGSAKCGRCWCVTQEELRFSPGRHGSHRQTQAASCSSCDSMCAVPRTCACYVGCFHAGHMIADWTDAWVRDSQLLGDSHAKSASQVQESLCQTINTIAKEAQSCLCFCRILHRFRIKHHYIIIIYLTFGNHELHKLSGVTCGFCLL